MTSTAMERRQGVIGHFFGYRCLMLAAAQRAADSVSEFMSVKSVERTCFVGWSLMRLKVETATQQLTMFRYRIGTAVEGGGHPANWLPLSEEGAIENDTRCRPQLHSQKLEELPAHTTSMEEERELMRP
jgi:hypothetical protein